MKTNNSRFPISIELNDKSFYWVKLFSDSQWEVGRYNQENDCFKLTNGSRKSDVVFEVGSEVVMPSGAFRYVWLNLNNGEFSNSWSEEEHKLVDDKMIENARKDNWKLIKYQCLSDQQFELYNMMKIVTSVKK